MAILFIVWCFILSAPIYTMMHKEYVAEKNGETYLTGGVLTFFEWYTLVWFVGMFILLVFTVTSAGHTCAPQLYEILGVNNVH